MLEQAARPESLTPTRRSSVVVWTLSLFVVFWVIFFILYRRFPYLKNGADVVFTAKLKWEGGGSIFPTDLQVLRLAIFGNSKILAGFVPFLFDQMAAADNLKVSSFNSGFPGSDLVIPPLQAMCERGQAPNILLLTLPWRADPPRRSVFRFVTDDHAVIQALFPFRSMARDLSSFLLNAPRNGGLVTYYRAAEKDATEVIASRGYYFISEQDRFPGGRLPDDFQLQTDEPNLVVSRTPGPPGSELTELNQLIDRYHIRCYYVPFYLRTGEAAAPPDYDQQFAASLERLTSCKVLGPGYYLYPNKLFSDQTHLNRAGAEVYTAALFHLLENKLK
jgi:hypothetical protein